MTDLRELEKRLEEATGPDRLIDFEFAIMTDAQLAKDAGVFASVRYTNGEFMLFFDGVGARGIIGDHMVPYVTASLDAALALVERCLPTAFPTIDRYSISDRPEAAQYNWRAWLKWLEGDDTIREAFSGTKSTPALALLLALIRALIAKGDRHD